LQLAKSGLRLTQYIIDCERWGRPQIHARAGSAREHVIGYWPGPTAQGDRSERVRWDLMTKALAALPQGSWTTYVTWPP